MCKYKRDLGQMPTAKGRPASSSLLAVKVNRIYHQIIFLMCMCILLSNICYEICIITNHHFTLSPFFWSSKNMP